MEDQTRYIADARNGGPEGDANVDKIRDILFGSQMRDYDRRFATVEERLMRESSALRDDLGQRLSATEQYVRGELDALGATLKGEERERMEGMREAMHALSALGREMTDRLSALADQTAQQHRDMRTALHEQHRALSEDLQRRHAEMLDALRREAADIRDAKADRTALASMFAGLAQRLSAGDPR